MSGQKSVDRALRLLNAFDLEKRELTVVELAGYLGTHVSTASRLSTALASWGLMEKNPETKKYRLGIRLIALASMVMAEDDLREVARPYLGELRNLSNQTVNLSCLDRGKAVNLEKLAGLYNIGNFRLGLRYDLHQSAAGKAMLAYQPESDIQNLISMGLRRYTPRTIVDGRELVAELNRVRAQGYALSLEEFQSGLHAVAAPIWDHCDKVKAAIAISGPADRLTLESLHKFGVILKERAREISRAIGCSPQIWKTPEFSGPVVNSNRDSHSAQDSLLPEALNSHC